MEYRVVWSIDLDAENETLAAEEARRIMKDPESIATFFDVMEAHHENVDWLEGILAEATVQINLE